MLRALKHLLRLSDAYRSLSTTRPHSIWDHSAGADHLRGCFKGGQEMR